jgi:hypothetical protein
MQAYNSTRLTNPAKQRCELRTKIITNLAKETKIANTFACEAIHIGYLFYFCEEKSHDMLFLHNEQSTRRYMYPTSQQLIVKLKLASQVSVRSTYNFG